MVGTPGAMSKRVVPILLISNGCVLGVTCNKPIKVSTQIQIKSQLSLCHGRLAIYTEFARVKTERVSKEETELLMREQIGSLILIHAMTIHYMQAFLYLCSLHNNNLLYCNPLICNIWYVCVLLHIPVCVISRVYACCGPACSVYY